MAMMDDKNDYELIEHHGIIGNMRTAALVSLKGVIDFLSFPRFDAPTVFASLLDKDKGGHFSIAPQMNDVVSRQLYIPGTAVLITRFFSETGIAEVTDYMPLRTDTCDTYNVIVRKVKAVRGNIDFIMQCHPGFDYGQAKHKSYRRNNIISFKYEKAGSITLRLSSDIEMLVKEGKGSAAFRLKESQVAHFVLESVGVGEEKAYADLDFFMNHTYFETIDYWRRWISQSTYKGRWSEIIIRSAITLKLLTSMEHGSVVAAATFGLPEEIGGDRNWDYRYTWIRDAAFTMFAFLKLGFFKEGKAFLNWIIKHAGQKDLHLIYKVDGKTDLTEKELKHLSGYKNSRPVRIGNYANDQFQLDMYGDLLDTIYIYNKFYQPITHELWELIVKEVEVVIRDWKKADHGIWEIRHAKKELLHSRLMCWVAMDRAIKIGIDRSFPFPVEQWEKVRDSIYNDIFYKFWNEQLQTWVQHKKGNTPGDTIDASLLLMPLVHFITPEEPRWKKTMEAINKNLRLDVLVYRYNNEHGFDGLNGKEGTFTMCSFWYIECLAKGKRLDEAIENFEKMLGYGNHLGLFAEQISKKGEHLGNFPQAFTHLGLISAALELDKQLNRIKRNTA
jgi:GH15 family glucan-1,4-alpha-glucosidase